MHKNYKTSVRRAARKLTGLGASCEHSFTFEDDACIRDNIDEIVDWLVERDARQRRTIQQLQRERDATI